MKLEYPKMIYKSREDYVIVKDIEEHEKMVDKGYMDMSVLKGEKPESVEEIQNEEPVKDVEDMTWNQLRSYAVELEKLYNRDIYSRGMKKEELKTKINEVLDGNSTADN